MASLQYAKVAEYQARGLVHFHALVRLDGPDGSGSPAPVDGEQLATLTGGAARAVTFTAPAVDHHDTPRVLAWGKQLDIRVVRQGRHTIDPNEPLSPEQVAGDLAKYATKDANSIRDRTAPRPHLIRLAATCRDLGHRARGDDLTGSPYLMLGKWAHMLGFRGHFSTKSRRYSITLGRLRRAQTTVSGTDRRSSTLGGGAGSPQARSPAPGRRRGHHPGPRLVGLPRHWLDPDRRRSARAGRGSPRPRVRPVAGRAEA